MTEYETSPQQPGQPEPGAPEETAKLRQPDGGGPAGSGDADGGGAPGRAGDQWSEPPGTQPAQAGQAARPEQAGPYTPPAGPYAPSPGSYTPSPGSYTPPPPPQSPWQPPTPYGTPPPRAEWQPSSAVPGSGAPAYEPQPAAAAGQPPPIGAPQSGPGEAPTTLLTPMGAPPGAGMYRQPSRAGRRLAAGAAVLALAVGSGVLGGWVALQADDDPVPATNVGSATNASNRNFSPAPVINRDDLANVAAAVQPSVVSIKTDDAQGSGVVYDGQGDIVTNNHVVADANGSVTVTFNDGKSADARIVNTDPRSDLAVVKVSNVSGLTPAKIGDSGAMRVGDTVLALGSPLGLDGTVTAGIISALDRTIQEGRDEQPQNPFRQQEGQVQSISGLLQTDAPINPGNSGGALANTKGEVIGINTAIYGDSGGNIGLGFAIPSNKVKAVADQLIKGEKVKHPFLGVSVADAPDGALVRTVVPDSPAAKAGIQAGDVITKIGGKTTSDSDDLVSAVQAGSVGDRLSLTYTRNGEQQTATVTLADAS